MLPLETTNYVPIILAMTIMSKNAAEYGLEGIVPDAPLEYDSMEITSPTHLALISDLTNTPVAELQSLNPALLRGLAPAGYSLHVPKGTGSYLRAALQMVPEERRASWRMHTVADGETLAIIGKRYRTTPGTIAAANHMQSAAPAVGDRLLIPAAYHEAAPVQAGPAKRSKSTGIRRRPRTGRRLRITGRPPDPGAGSTGPPRSPKPRAKWRAQHP